MQTLRRQDLLDVTNGACILASGGGGPISIKETMVDLLVREGPVKIVGLDEVGDNALVAVVAGAGSPATLAKAGGIAELVTAATAALDSMEKVLQRKVDFISSIETGVGNTLLPMAASVRKKIPLLDGAGARRSVPEITMCTFSELPVAPIQLVDAKGNVIGLDVSTAAHGEGALMALVGLPQFGDLAGLSFWPMQGSIAKAHTSPATLTYTLGLGRALREAKKRKDDPVKTVTEYLEGYLLFRGKIADIETHTSDAVDFVVVVIENNTGQTLRIYGQNESLIAWRSDRPYPLAMGPDLICYLTASGQCFSNADIPSLPKNSEVAVIAAAAEAGLRTKQIESAFLGSLRNLGYGGPYVPVEELSRLGDVEHRAQVARVKPRSRVALGW